MHHTIRMALGATRGQVLLLALVSTARDVNRRTEGRADPESHSKGSLIALSEGSTHNPVFFAAAMLLLVVTSAQAACIPGHSGLFGEPRPQIYNQSNQERFQ